MVILRSDYGCYVHRCRGGRRFMRIPRLVAVAAGITAVVAAVASGSGWNSGASSAVKGAGLADVAVRPGVQHVGHAQLSPPTTASCRKDYKVACYQPAQIQQAYHLPALYARGITGGAPRSSSSTRSAPRRYRATWPRSTRPS